MIRAKNNQSSSLTLHIWLEVAIVKACNCYVYGRIYVIIHDCVYYIINNSCATYLSARYMETYSSLAPINSVSTTQITVYVVIFEGRKFCKFRCKLAEHKFKPGKETLSDQQKSNLDLPSAKYKTLKNYRVY